MSTSTSFVDRLVAVPIFFFLYTLDALQLKLRLVEVIFYKYCSGVIYMKR
jgi:hypothetical protein